MRKKGSDRERRDGVRVEGRGVRQWEKRGRESEKRDKREKGD